MWVGLTAAIAVMIMIHDRQEQAKLANKDGREVALAPAKLENKPADAKFGEPEVNPSRRQYPSLA